MSNFQAPMTNKIPITQCPKLGIGICGFIRHSDLVIGKLYLLITAKIRLTIKGQYGLEFRVYMMN